MYYRKKYYEALARIEELEKELEDQTLHIDIDDQIEA